MRVCEPLGLRVPPLILRAITSGRTLRSARLLWEGTPGTATSATWYIHVGADACTWTAKSDADWLEIKNPATGVYVHLTDVPFTGTTDIKVHALTNAGPKRVGHFIINGVVYTVTQGGA